MEAILVVSFGTSFEDTRKITIEAIENDITNEFSDKKIYRAWTSKMIMAKILKRDGIKVLNVCEAMQQMKADGITDIIVQPTHVMNGIENDIMKADVNGFSNEFNSICFGDPLLTTEEDVELVVEVMGNEFSDIDKDTAVVLMGHGSDHYANMAYSALDYSFKEKDFDNFFIGTVEAYPSLETVMKMVKKAGYKKVMLSPFMIVSGDHARNDLVGEDEDSWYNEFKSNGFEVSYRLKGIGEYKAIRDIFVKHIKEL